VPFGKPSNLGILDGLGGRTLDAGSLSFGLTSPFDIICELSLQRGLDEADGSSF
jgi:hypothetical protein